MNSQLLLLVILFCALLIKGFWQAAKDNDWTPLKVRKFYAYIGINVFIPLFVIYLFNKYMGYEASISSNTPNLADGLTVFLDLGSFLSIYLLTLLGLFLSLKLWPFAITKRETFKTLMLVVAVIFLVELVTSYSLPKPGPVGNGNLV